MRRILVTGSTGFVGRHLCAALARKDFAIRAVVRGSRGAPCGDVFRIGDLGEKVNWDPALKGVDVVVHLAARAHEGRMKGDSQRYMEVNAHGTRMLAEAAAGARIRRFIYVSSVKVNGESTSLLPFSGSDEVHPLGIYAESKWLGEKYLKRVAAASGMECVVVRPPLVYGPGVKANFLALMRWIDSGLPLPFGGVHNSRSLVSIWNLSDFLVCLASRSEPPVGTWMISDGRDLSTSALVEIIARAMERKVKMFRVPEWLLRSGAALMGFRAAVDKLYGSLVVDMGVTSRSLGWQPVMSVEDGIARTVDAYLEARRA